MTAILCICIVIYSLQILGDIMVTLLGFKRGTQSRWCHPCVGTQSVAQVAQNRSRGPGYVCRPPVSCQVWETRKLGAGLVIPHLLLRWQGNTLKINVKVRLKMFIRTALLLNWGNFIWKIHWVETFHSQKHITSWTILYKFVNWEGCWRAVSLESWFERGWFLEVFFAGG